jgi:hypothetical protein
MAWQGSVRLMTIPIEYDRRYKVTNEIISEMRGLKKQGLSCRAIAEKMGLNVSIETIRYWCNDEFRIQKRKIIAQLHKTKERQKKEVPYLKYKRHKFPESQFKHQINYAKQKGYNVYGVPLKDALEAYEKIKCKTNKKVMW